MDPTNQQMKEESKEFDADVQYFEVPDPLEEEKKDEGAEAASEEAAPSGQAYCQVKIEFDRATYEELTKKEDDAPKKTSADVLVFFCDKSGSMSGKPYQTVKDGLINMADTIFGEKEEDNAFRSVHTVWFDNYVEPHVTSKKEAYLADLRRNHSMGGTDFYPCFDYIEKLIKSEPEGTRISVVFLTDGQGSYDRENSCPNLKKLCDQMAAEQDKNVAIYSLGFSAGHDAQLLNGLAQSGSEQGNFIYIPFEGDIMAKMKDALESSLSMALSARGQRLEVTSSTLGFEFKISKAVKADYTFPELENKKDEKKDEMEDDDQIEEKDMSTWTSVTFTTAYLVPMKELKAGELVMTLHLDEVEVSCKPFLAPVAESAEAMKAEASLDLINRRTFELIQKIQEAGLSADDRKKALLQLQKIDDALNRRGAEYGKLKDRALKKKLMAQVMEKKMESAKVLGLLRGIQDLSHLPNEVIAQINDVAYKAVQTNALQKMLDKRALVNEERMQKLDAEIDEIVEKLDLEKLAAQHKDVVEDIGACALSCMDVIDTLEMGDCMCIGLEFEKPEAAIADPSRLIIKNIVPTYTSSESFLQSAKFALKQKQAGANRYGYGEETETAPSLMTGVGNEKINGVMPLYLFDQHWWLAKRKINPVLGFMVTDDVLGFTNEQLQTVPFLVLIRAMEQQNETPSESNSTVLSRVLETCVQMIRHNKGLRKLVAERVHAFAYQPDNVSARTVDVVKSKKVLAAQFMCLLKAEDLPKQLSSIEELAEITAFFVDAPKLKTTQERFYRAAIEEQMRSFVDKSFSDFFLSVLDKYLLKGADQFVEKTFDRRTKELEDERRKEEAEGDKGSKYSTMASNLRQKYGYDMATGTIREESKMSDTRAVAKPVNFDKEIATFLGAQNLLTGEAIKLVEKVGSNYDGKPVFKELRMLCQALFGQEFATLRVMPGFAQLSDDDYNMVLLATIIQNAHQKENRQRVLAVKEGRYVDIQTAADARGYLEALLGKKLKETLKQQESVIVKKALTAKMDVVVDKVLKAPDVFIAAAIAKENGMSIGRGDFSKAIVKLCERDAKAVPDLANKLVLLKTGCILHKDQLAQPITDELLESLTEEQAMKVFADGGVRVSKENHCITAKHVFKLWSKHVYVGKEVTQEQIENIFPEFSDRLQLYGKCCDETGKAVRNLDYYKQYRATPHQFRKRGGLKKDPAQQKAKAAFAKKRDAEMKGPDEKQD